VWLLLLCTACLGLGQAFEMTARQAYVVDTLGVHRVVQGIALIALAQRSGGVLGALIGGAAVEWYGPSVAFVLMGLSYGAGAGVLYALRSPGVAAPSVREPLRRNIGNYIRALRSNQDMRNLMISTAAAELFGFSHQVLLPILAREVLHVGAGALGVLTAFRFLGGVLGVAMLTALGEIRRRGRLLMLVVLLFGLGQIGLAQATHFWFAVACVLFINIMAAATDILHQTLLQVSVSNEQRGRAMGAWIVGTGAAPLGHLEVGYVAALTSVSLALLGNGAALMCLTLALALFMPRLRRL
jgi:MFS family permease